MEQIIEDTRPAREHLIVANTRLVIFGGYDASGSLNEVHAFDMIEVRVSEEDRLDLEPLRRGSLYHPVSGSIVGQRMVIYLKGYSLQGIGLRCIQVVIFSHLRQNHIAAGQ